MRMDWEEIQRLRTRKAALERQIADLDRMQADSDPRAPRTVNLFAMNSDGDAVVIEVVPLNVARDRAQAQLGAVISWLAYHEHA